MSPIRSRLFWKAFLSLVAGLLLWLPVFYGLTVPFINQQAYEVEEKAGRNVLDNVVETAIRAHRDIESWEEAMLAAHQRDLRNIVMMAVTWGEELDRQVKAGRMSRQAAREQLFSALRRFRYGQEDYVWVADRQGVMVAHPDRALEGRDASHIRDAKGDLVIPLMVEKALSEGEGYHRYWWRRLDTEAPAEKLSYFRYLPQWQLVVGTGVYVDDIAAEVARRREAVIAELRAQLGGVRLTGSGYVFVVDGTQNVVIHPDADLEGKSMGTLRDPASGQSLWELLAEAARRPDRTAHYLWDRPEDRGNLVHPKVAWVHYLPGYDWYIGATVYTADLALSGHELTRRLLLAFLVGLLLTAAFAFLFIRSIAAPILRLAKVAQRQVAGDLTATSDLQRRDEIGILSEAFNAMVVRLRGQIDTLEERVAQRTRELADWAATLESRVAERTAEVQTSEAKFRSLLEQSLVGTFVIAEDRFLYVNEACARLLGFVDPEAMMREGRLSEVVAPADREHIALLVDAIVAGTAAGTERAIQAARRDGSLIDVEVSGRLVIFEGRPALVGIMLDVTGRKQAERAREQALAAAEELSRLKSEFIANMSHELRTPLNWITGMAHVGQRSSDQEKVRNSFAQILTASQQLLAMVSQVLDFAKVDGGSLKLVDGTIVLRTLIDDALSQAAPRAAARGLTCDVALLPGLPAICRGDGERLRQILAVLLDNAIKFTEQGAVSVSVGLERGDLIFRVVDTGIGIAPEQMSAVFRPFEQVDGGAARRHGGIGLSLALARRLAIHMGGSLEVLSQLGTGSTFILRVPYRSIGAQ